MLEVLLLRQRDKSNVEFRIGATLSYYHASGQGLTLHKKLHYFKMARQADTTVQIINLQRQLAALSAAHKSLLADSLRAVAAEVQAAVGAAQNAEQVPTWSAEGVVKLVKTCAGAVYQRLLETVPSADDILATQQLTVEHMHTPHTDTHIGQAVLSTAAAPSQCPDWPVCRACHGPTPPASAFCGNCGQPMAAAAVAPSTATQHSAIPPPAPVSVDAALDRQSSMPQQRAKIQADMDAGRAAAAAAAAAAASRVPPQHDAPVSEAKVAGIKLTEATAAAQGGAGTPPPAEAPPPIAQPQRTASRSHSRAHRSGSNARSTSRAGTARSSSRAGTARSSSRAGASSGRSDSGTTGTADALNAYLESRNRSAVAAAAAEADFVARAQASNVSDEQRRARDTARRSGRRRGERRPVGATGASAAAVPTAASGSSVSSRVRIPVRQAAPGRPAAAAEVPAGAANPAMPHTHTAASSSAPPATAPQETARSHSSESAAVGGGEGGGDPWVQACTEEGRVYFWHKVTRATRWEKPDEATTARMQSRLEHQTADAAARTAARLAEMAAAEADAALREEVRAVVAAQVDAAVATWHASAGWPGRAKGLAAPALGKMLALLLLQLHTLPHLQRLPGQGDSEAYAFVATLRGDGSDAGSALNKAYLRAVRVVHPDKLPTGENVTVQQRLMSQSVFDTLATVQSAFKERS